MVKNRNRMSKKAQIQISSLLFVLCARARVVYTVNNKYEADIQNPSYTVALSEVNLSGWFFVWRMFGYDKKTILEIGLCQMSRFLCINTYMNGEHI